MNDVLLLGKNLIETKLKLPNGEFSHYIKSKCRFSHRTANRVMLAYKQSLYDDFRQANELSKMDIVENRQNNDGDNGHIPDADIWFTRLLKNNEITMITGRIRNLETGGGRIRDQLQGIKSRFMFIPV